MKVRPKLPGEGPIRAYWASTKVPELKGFDSAKEFMEPGICFACGFDARPLYRAHIQARSTGGPDDPSNLHMLCRACHEDSEYLEGERYWQWFFARTAFDGILARFARLGGNLSSTLGLRLDAD